MFSKFFCHLSVVFLLWTHSVYASDHQVPDLFTYNNDEENGRQPFLTAIKKAEKYLKIAAYRIDDDKILDAILGARKRGLTVHVMVERETYQHDKSGSSNDSALRRMKQAGISIYDRPSWVEQIHHKVVILDGKEALLTTGNFDHESFDGDGTYTGTRDFTVRIVDSEMINEIEQTFDHDRESHQFASRHENLLWGPKNQKDRFIKLINRANNCISIYQQDIQDLDICRTLIRQMKENKIQVRLVMIPFPFSKEKDNNFANQKKLRSAGAQVRFLEDGTYVHAKTLIIDPDSQAPKAYVGSCNFYPSSLEKNRELGIILTGHQRIQKLNSIFEKDFKNGSSTHPLERK